MISFTHTQSESSTTWVVEHNLNNVAPNVNVMINYGGQLQSVLPLSVTADDANQVTVEFSSAQTGQVHVSA